MAATKTLKHPAKVKRRGAKIRAAIGGPIFGATKGSKEPSQTTLFVTPDILNEVKNLPDGKLTVTFDFTRFIQNAKPGKRGQVQAAIGGPLLGEIFRQLNMQRTTSLTAASVSRPQAVCGVILGSKKTTSRPRATYGVKFGSTKADTSTIISEKTIPVDVLGVLMKNK